MSGASEHLSWEGRQKEVRGSHEDKPRLGRDTRVCRPMSTMLIIVLRPLYSVYVCTYQLCPHHSHLDKSCREAGDEREVIYYYLGGGQKRLYACTRGEASFFSGAYRFKQEYSFAVNPFLAVIYITMGALRG